MRMLLKSHKPPMKYNSKNLLMPWLNPVINFYHVIIILPTMTTDFISNKMSRYSGRRVVPLISWFHGYKGEILILLWMRRLYTMGVGVNICKYTNTRSADMSVHDDVINGNIFRATGHLCGEFTGHRWISHTKASDAELWCFLWSVPE